MASEQKAEWEMCYAAESNLVQVGMDLGNRAELVGQMCLVFAYDRDLADQANLVTQRDAAATAEAGLLDAGHYAELRGKDCSKFVASRILVPAIVLAVRVVASVGISAADSAGTEAVSAVAGKLEHLGKVAAAAH